MAPLQSRPASSPDPGRRFTPDLLAGLDEPVRRCFRHAIRDGAALPNGVRMAMSGRIKVGLWLPFIAEQTVDGRSFTWRARVGRGPVTPLRVTDRYADAAGSTEGRLLARLSLFRAHDGNTAWSAATRAAIESVVFAPPSVLPDRGVTWRARPEASSSLASTFRPSARRFAPASTNTARYEPSAPCAGATPARKPSSTSRSEARSRQSAAAATSCFPAARASAGVRHPRYAPFFRAEISAVTPTL